MSSLTSEAIVPTEQEPFDLDVSRNYWRFAPSGKGKVDSSVLLTLSDNNFAAAWQEHFDSRTSHYWEENRLVRHFGRMFSGKTVLSFGSGLGLNEVHFMRFGAHVTCADIVSSNLKTIERICKLKRLDANFIHLTDTVKTPFGGPYDFVYANGSLMTMPAPMQRQVLEKFKNALKPGGMIILNLYTWKFVKDTCGVDSPIEFAKRSDPSVGDIHNPWSDWHDDDKLKELAGPDLTIVNRQFWNQGHYVWFGMKHTREASPGRKLFVDLGKLESSADAMVLDLSKFQKAEASVFKTARRSLDIVTTVNNSLYAALSPVVDRSRWQVGKDLEIAVDATVLDGSFSLSVLDESKQKMVFARPIMWVDRERHYFTVRADDVPNRFRVVFSNFREGQPAASHIWIHQVSVATARPLYPEEETGVDIATAAKALEDSVKTAISTVVSGGTQPQMQVEMAVPFSRAAVRDYLRLVDLWRSGGPQQMDKGSRRCPACGSNHSSFIFYSYDNFPYHSCDSCGVWFVPVALTADIWDNFYRAVPEAKDISRRMAADRDVSTRASDYARFNMYFDMLAPLLSGRSPVQYLDVGCGVGHSVELAASRGFNALGVELDETAVATARAANRNVVVPSNWDGKGTFDLVSLFETLEHIPDPDAVMESVNKVLAPDGLLIVTVPNKDSWEVSLLQERCFHVYGGVDGIGHINLFNLEGLRILFRRHNLELIFSDGHFGSNLLQIFAQLQDPNLTIPRLLKDDTFQISIPRAVHTLLNVVGPSVSLHERAVNRSPILIAVACRADAEDRFRSSVADLQRKRKEEIMSSLGSV